jgi:hypothetical protein
MENNFYRVWYYYDATEKERFMNTEGKYEYIRGKEKIGKAYFKTETRAEAEQIKTEMLNGKSWGNAIFDKIA